MAGGQLIAVDGMRGRVIAREAEYVRDKMKRKSGVRAVISRWDASGLFYELRAAGKKSLALSPRTLLLVYAADLAFRLRWEIRPALEAGHAVIAAPYVETAFAFGKTAGISRRWVAELLRFAPETDIRVDAEHGKRRPLPKPRAGDGFLEFAAIASRTLRRRTPGKRSKDR